MTTRNLITLLLMLSGLVLVMPVFAQRDESQNDEPQTDQKSDDGEAEKTDSGSQEVEYGDENYRRFMELKDQSIQRSTLPTNTYQSGTQKLDKLPEASQKHLRNQLREIILTGDEWAPGDEDKEFPYVPSQAAEKDSELQQKELEAWGELVGKYNEREAQIYADSANAKSDNGTENGAQSGQQAQAGNSASQSAAGEDASPGKKGSGKDQKQAGQENQTAGNPNEGSDSSSSSASTTSSDPNAVSTAGVSQSALEYLLGNNSKTGGKTGSTGESNGSPGAPNSGAEQQNQQQQAGSDAGQDGSASQQTMAQQSAGQQSANQEPGNQQQAGQQQAGQQSASQEANAQQQAAADSAEAESESMAQQQSPQQQDQQQSASNNPSEFVVISKGTLSIKDLQNAQGITNSTGSNTSGSAPIVIPEEHLRKDDDG